MIGFQCHTSFIVQIDDCHFRVKTLVCYSGGTEMCPATNTEGQETHELPCRRRAGANQEIG